MRQQIIKAIKQYAADNGLTFDSHVFIDVEDTLEATVIGVYLQKGQSVIPMLNCISRTVLGSSPDSNLRADFYTLLSYKTRQVSPGTVLIYFPNLPSKILDEKAFNRTVNADYGIPLTERDKVFRNALDRYIRRFGESFPLFEFQGTVNDAIYTMNECIRKGRRYFSPLWDNNGNPILYQKIE